MRKWIWVFTLFIIVVAFISCFKNFSGNPTLSANSYSFACRSELNGINANRTSRPLPNAGEVENWTTDVFTDAAKLPFSFTYGGQSSVTLLPTWGVTTSSQAIAGGTERTITLTDPTTKLEVRAIATYKTGQASAEWLVWFKNTGTADTPIIENIMPLDADEMDDTTATVNLHFASGSTLSESEFQPLHASVRPDSCFQFSARGRSSDPWLPFFHIRHDSGGLLLAVGWSGQWRARLEKSVGKFRLLGGLEQAHLSLQPGEEIRTPSIRILPYSGEYMVGQNAWRADMLKNSLPASAQAGLPTAGSPFSVYDLNQTNETNMKDLVDSLSTNNLPVDTWWIDAGWFALGWDSVGSWSPHPDKYPNGLKPVSDLVHSKGMKFLLWFEPERVTTESDLKAQHPDWLLGTGRNLLLNLGNPQALAWAKTHFSNLITSEGIDVFRMDFNLDPLSNWHHAEPANRVGINEIKHVMGLYEFLDTLLSDHPNLLIDDCAAGGRRIDIEMLKRSVVLWPSDHWYGVLARQSIQYGLSLWVPSFGYGTKETDLYEFRSTMGAALVFFGYYNKYDAAGWNTARKLLNQYIALKPLYFGDYYPLTPYNLLDNSEMAMEFYRPDLGKGMVVALRRPKNMMTQWKFKLQGLDAAATYSLRNADTDATWTQSGQDLMSNGLAVTINDRPGSALILFEK